MGELQESAAAQRLRMGQHLLEVRARFPRRGPKASGWTAYLREVGVDQATAWRYMELAKHPERSTKSKEPRPRVAGVYFIQGIVGGPIKIGHSGDVEARLSALQAGSPVELRILSVVPGGRVLEHDLHKALARHRSHGEWFFDCDALRRAMRRLAQ